jgi:hypothetical protein
MSLPPGKTRLCQEYGTISKASWLAPGSHAVVRLAHLSGFPGGTMPTQRRPPAHRALPEPQGTPPANGRPPAEGTPLAKGTPLAEGAPSSQPDTPGVQPWQVPPCPCHPPATGRPLPDLTALRLAAVPDSSPPYDDQLRTGPLPWPGEYSPLSAAPHAEAPPHANGSLHAQASPHAGTPPPAGEAPGGAAPPGPDGKRGVNQQPRDDRQPRGSAEKAQRGDGERSPSRHGDPAPGGRTRPAPGGRTAGPAERRPGNGGGAEPGEWPSQFAQVLAETLAGSRPASQIVPWTTERARAHIRRLGPLLAVEQRPRVQRVITSRPAEDVVEVAAIIGFGPRTRALAARLELARPRAAVPGRPAREARWLCTAIESA